MKSGCFLNNFAKNWYTTKTIKYALTHTYIYILAMLILIPFDYILFGKENPYSPLRLYFISYLFISLIGIYYILKGKTKNYLAERIILTSQHIILLTLYAHFLQVSEPDSFQMVLMGTFLLVFFSALMMHRFLIEYTIYFIYTVLLFETLAIAQSNNQFQLIVISSTGAYIVNYFFRKEFFNSIQLRYIELSKIIPKIVAKTIASDGAITDIQKYFPTKERSCLCILADIRGYQQLTSNEDTNTIKKILDVFHFEFRNFIEDYVEVENYIYNWHADEAFIVVFCEEEDSENILSNKLYNLIKNIDKLASTVNSKIGEPIHFDIGADIGTEKIGIFGPQDNLKLTVLGKTPGIAKRLETVAKNQREKNNQNAMPIIAIRNKLTVKNLSNYYEVIADTKDIKGERIYIFDTNNQRPIKLNLAA